MGVVTGDDDRVGEHVSAHEAAADSASWVETCRTAFTHGWDTAMAYVSRKASEGVEYLDSDECCHFQD
jgi:hypothetical protein